MILSPAFADSSVPKIGIRSTCVTSHVESRMSSVLDQKTLRKRVANFLRRVHPTKTVVHVAADTGCSVYQVEKWLEEAGEPNAAALRRLIGAYGPDFLTAFLPGQFNWLDAAIQSRAASEVDAELAALAKRIEQIRSNL